MGEQFDKLILVVDDEEAVRNYLSMALEDAGFRVKTANDGFEALEAVKEELPDLISLDLVMPKHSGLKFYRNLQKNSDWSKIPVIIVTGHAKDDLGRDDFEELTVSGPGVYIEKPVKPHTYVKAVNDILGLESVANGQAEKTKLKEELNEVLEGANADALKEALELLKKKKS